MTIENNSQNIMPDSIEVMTKKNAVGQNHDFDPLRRKIKALMEAKGFTQKELGEHILMTQSNVAKCLSLRSKNKRIFTLEQICKLSDLFDISMDDLLCRKKESNNETNDYSIEKICEFLTLLIKKDRIIPCRYSKTEEVWEDNGFGIEYTAQRETEYKAFYFANYDNPQYLRSPEEHQDWMYIASHEGNVNFDNIKINRYLNNFIDTFVKFKKGDINRDEFEIIVNAYIKNIRN